MKKFLFIFLILSYSIIGQDRFNFDGPDTAYSNNSFSKYLTYLIVVDSSDTYDDTVSVKIKTSDDAAWYPVGLKQIDTDEVLNEAVPTDGVTTSYLILRANAKQIMIEKKGSGACSVWIEYVSPY